MATLEKPAYAVNPFTRFLWWCAGADQRFLLLSPYQDRVKYAGIGLSIPLSDLKPWPATSPTLPGIP
jgi:hypothetical protein